VGYGLGIGRVTFFCARRRWSVPAKPTRPVPSRRMLDGSGVDATGVKGLSREYISQGLKPRFDGRIDVRAEARTYLKGNSNCLFYLAH